MKLPVMSEETIRACSRYSGGGFFVKPTVSKKEPSPVLHAPEMIAYLLALLDAERAKSNQEVN